MDSFQGTDFLWSGKVQVFLNDDVSKINGKLVAPHWEPGHIAKCFSFRQCQRDVFVAIFFQDAIASPFISDAETSLVAWHARASNVKVGSRTFTIVCEPFDEQRSGVDGKNIAGNCMMQLRQSAYVCAIISLSGAQISCFQKMITLVKPWLICKVM